MNIKVVIMVYNRVQNVQRWIRCWKTCNQENAELIVIHNYPDKDQRERLRSICEENEIKYVPRENIGFDIGALQDVCKERLNGFPNDWDYLLWCTDDCVPMRKNFIKPFIDTLHDPSVGISAMKISTSVSPHVRTTGFCLTKEISRLLTFPADPVKTKQECYLFEHRGGAKTLANQIRAMGLSCRQVAPSSVSPLWDMGYWKRLNRQAEHDAVFPGKKLGDKVTFICTIYNTYPQIISSLILQTHQNWELILIHDGPNETGLKKIVNGDPRIKYIETEKRHGNWGHYHRSWALNEMRDGKLSDGDYVVITNADNYFTPVFTEYLLNGFKKSHTAVATYCDKMCHSYKAWDIIPVRLEKGFVDCAGVMVKKEIACEIGWRDTESHSSDWTYFSDIASKYSTRNFIPVKGCLFVHN